MESSCRVTGSHGVVPTKIDSLPLQFERACKGPNETSTEYAAFRARLKQREDMMTRALVNELHLRARAASMEEERRRKVSSELL